MAYNGKTNWRPNTPVTEDDFNRIEQGITDAHDNIDEHTEKDAPHDGHEKTANKARPGGYASLDSGGNVPEDQLGNLPDNVETETGAQDKVDEHANRDDNPHNVTTEQIGAETPTGAQDKADDAETSANNYTDRQVSNHTSRTDNPHNVTKAQVGLSNVTNEKQATKTEFDAHQGDDAPHQYGGRFEWRYNATTDSLDLVVIE